MAILYSKVTRPTPTPQILDRPRLYARLDRWQTTPVVFVHAPAGYGKSMLVSRWIGVRGLAAQSAWLSLDPGDDAPVQFVRYLAAALEPVVPGILVAVEPVLDTPEPHPMRALEVMLGTVDQVSDGDNDTPILLVLDDLHHVDSPGAGPTDDPGTGTAAITIALYAPRASGHLWAADPALRGRRGVGDERGRTALSTGRDRDLLGPPRFSAPHIRGDDAVG